LTRREIVDKLRSFKTCWHDLPYEKMESYFEELADAVEALPGPTAGPAPDLHGTPWPPGRSMVAIVPGDCLISLKAAIEAGARIVIEPANPESDP
jgi:hypothetical protein